MLAIKTSESVINILPSASTEYVMLEFSDKAWWESKSLELHNSIFKRQKIREFSQKSDFMGSLILYANDVFLKNNLNVHVDTCEHV